jgi:hypothetical protein
LSIGIYKSLNIGISGEEKLAGFMPKSLIRKDKYPLEKK